MAHFIPIARVQAAALLNRVCFLLKLFPGRQCVLSENPLSAYFGFVVFFYFGLFRFCSLFRSVRLQSCMLTEDGYPLDSMTYIEIESFVSFGGHSKSWQ